ncbi:MAG TPA: APC family permease [Xanthobacteraceae bacterium]
MEPKDTINHGDGDGAVSSSPLLRLASLLLGRPLANRESRQRAIGIAEAVPALGLDGLSSSAYGPEAALSILVAAGAMGLASLDPIMLAILALLATLFASYWQTIEAYPQGGGAYTVAQDNLGVNASLLAAAALMVDYVLNVAVGIAAGVAALVSAVPVLHAYTLLLCLGILVLLTIVNLRGTAEAGRLFALPTYLFVGCFLIVIAIGSYGVLTSGGHPHALVAPPALPKTGEAVGFWLLLRAFASGCTAMTGVEAVSNGVNAFREPRVTNARFTLTIIVVTLAILLGGIAFLATSYGIMAMNQTQPGYQSVLSQLVGAVAGRGIFYYVAIASALCILCLSANTSFVGLPRLCQIVAQDEFLPRPFALVGRRLVYSVGIIYVALTAGLLLAAFDGITDRLIPLFAIGAFLTFTISQAGMVEHWRRKLHGRCRGAERRRVWTHLIVNAVGAAATVVALLVIITAKFTEGGWITIVAIPCVIVLLKAIKQYYRNLDDHLRDDGPLEFGPRNPPIVLVAMREWNRLTDKALGLAMQLSPDVTAVHLAALEGPDVKGDEQKLRQQWAEHVENPAQRARCANPPQLLFLSAPYRRMHAPLLKLIRELKDKNPQRTIAVMIPEFVKRHWWEWLLSTQRARRLRAAVLEYGGSGVEVIGVPWHLTEPKIEEAMTEEEAAEPFRVRHFFRLRRSRTPRRRSAPTA